MSEHRQPAEEDEEFERERRDSTDLGYRDTEEERAYEEAEPERPGDGPTEAEGSQE